MYKNSLFATKFLILSSIILSFLLTGCASRSSKEKDLSLQVHQRAAEITSALPVKNGQYNFVMARPLPPATLELVVYADTVKNAESDDRFLNDFTRSLCTTPKSRALLQAGAQYQIRLRRSSNQEKIQVIHYATCPAI